MQIKVCGAETVLISDRDISSGRRIMVDCASGVRLRACRHLLVVETGPAPDHCRHCEARGRSVCSVLDHQDLHRLATAGTVIEIDAGHTFITEGDPADHFFNITHGTAKLYKLLPDGRRQITGFSHSGDFLGLAVSHNYAFSAEALEPLRFCRFTRKALRAVLDDFPAMEKRLLEVASQELVMAQEQMLLLGRKTARERVASFLLDQERLHRPRDDGQPEPIRLPMTRGDIADYLGLTIETVSRTFTRLKTEGLIALPAIDRVALLDREGLAIMADGYGS
jgi:CRP/FNR family transcriptional regulator